MCGFYYKHTQEEGEVKQASGADAQVRTHYSGIFMSPCQKQPGSCLSVCVCVSLAV